VHGGYGPRLFRHRAGNQVQSAIEALKRGPSTRRAVVQIFDAEDVASRHKEVPCTCTLQFLVRRQRLHMLVSMRSNDAYKGLPHDVFCFTMLQEISRSQHRYRDRRLQAVRRQPSSLRRRPCPGAAVS
jgi:thymidylate synthase